MTDNQHRLIAMGHLAKELNSEQCQLSGILKINTIMMKTCISSKIHASTLIVSS